MRLRAKRLGINWRPMLWISVSFSLLIQMRSQQGQLKNSRLQALVSKEQNWDLTITKRNAHWNSKQSKTFSLKATRQSGKQGCPPKKLCKSSHCSTTWNTTKACSTIPGRHRKQRVSWPCGTSLQKNIQAQFAAKTQLEFSTKQWNRALKRWNQDKSSTNCRRICLSLKLKCCLKRQC